MPKQLVPFLVTILALFACKQGQNDSKSGASDPILLKLSYHSLAPDSLEFLFAKEEIGPDGKVLSLESYGPESGSKMLFRLDYGYDSAGNRIRVVQTEESQAIDEPQGPLNIMGIPAGEMVTTTYLYRFDRHDQWTKLEIYDHHDSLFLSKTRQLNYDSTGHLISEVTTQDQQVEGWNNPPLHITHTYDERGNRLSSTTRDSTGQPLSTTKFTYNQQDSIISRSYFVGSEGTATSRAEIEFDSMDRKTRELRYQIDETGKEQLTLTITYAYDKQGRLIRESYRIKGLPTRKNRYVYQNQ